MLCVTRATLVESSSANIPSLSSAIANCAVSSVEQGTCQSYPADGLCTPFLPANASVYIPSQLTVAYFEQLVASAFQLAETNKEIAGPACFQKIVQLICVKTFLSCVPSPVAGGVEDLPILACASFCADVWDVCAEPFRLYWLNVIAGNYQTSPLPNCALGGTFNASWGAQPQPPDTFGGRVVPKNIPTITGLLNIRQFPVGIYRYQYTSNTSLGSELLTCNTPPNSVNITDIVFPEVQCQSPLLSDGRNGCVMPCPFTVFDDEVNQAMQAAYVGPAILGLILCVFVCVDSLWLVGESYGCQTRARRLLPTPLPAVSGVSQRNGTGEGTNNSSNTGQSSRIMVIKKPLQASTFYALSGSILGLIYFFVGPLGTLQYGSSISCAAPTIDIFSIGEGAILDDPPSCTAQRASPFVLQAIFNLILNSMVRVYIVVRNEKMSPRMTTLIDIVLFGYCIGEPMLALFFAFYFDQLSTDVFDASVQLSRQSVVCMVRLTRIQEWIILYVPFFVTGSAVIIMSVMITRHLNSIRKRVAKTKIKNSSADLGMRLLIQRLVGLGLATFVTLCVVIGTSVAYTVELGAFSPALITYLQCVQSVGTSLQCVDCNVWKKLYQDSEVTPSVLGAQLASESMIVVLFAGFFFAQTLARIYKQRLEAMQAGLTKVIEVAKKNIVDLHKSVMRRPADNKPREAQETAAANIRESTKNPIFQLMSDSINSDSFEYVATNRRKSGLEE